MSTHVRLFERLPLPETLTNIESTMFRHRSNINSTKINSLSRFTILYICPILESFSWIIGFMPITKYRKYIRQKKKCWHTFYTPCCMFFFLQCPPPHPAFISAWTIYQQTIFSKCTNVYDIFRTVTKSLLCYFNDTVYITFVLIEEIINIEWSYFNFLLCTCNILYFCFLYALYCYSHMRQ